MNKTISIKSLRKIIEEEAGKMVDAESIDEVEALEDAWSGGSNLAHDLDHPAVYGAPETTSSPETLSIVDDRGVYRMSESKLRTIIRNIILA